MVSRLMLLSILSLLLTSCAIYPDRLAPKQLVTKVKKKRFAELAVTFTELGWNSNRTGNVDVVKSYDAKTYIKLKQAAFSPFEKSTSFHQVFDREGKENTKVDLRFHLKIIDDGTTSFLSRSWQWASFLTLMIVPYYANFKVRYELIVYNNKMKTVGRFSGSVDCHYWQSIILIPQIFRTFGKFEKVIGQFAREVVSKFEASEI